MFEQILEAFGIKDYDELNSSEKETLREWVDKIEKSAITLDDVKSGVVKMREGVEAELSRHEYNDRQDIFLKARLRNLIVMETILTRPEKARAALDGYLAKARNTTK